MARPKSENAGDDKNAGEKRISQMEMVRMALEDLGAKAKPKAIQEHIKSRFDKELAPTIVSNYKSVLKRKGGSGRRTSGTGGVGAIGGIKVEDLQLLRGLVNRLGQNQVHELVKVFAE